MGVRVHRARRLTPVGMGSRPMTLRPSHVDNRCWSAHTMAADTEAIAGLDRTLAEGASRSTTSVPSWARGVSRLALDHRRPARSADDAALAKIFTKAYFARRVPDRNLHGPAGRWVPRSGWTSRACRFRTTLDGQPRWPRATAPCPSWRGPRSPGWFRSSLTSWPWPRRTRTPTAGSDRAIGRRPRPPGVWATTAARSGSSRETPRAPGSNCGSRAPTPAPTSARAMFLGAAVWGIEHGLEPPPPIQAPGRRTRPQDRALAAPRPHRSCRTVRRERRGPRALRFRLRRALRRIAAGRGAGLSTLRLGARTCPLPALRLRKWECLRDDGREPALRVDRRAEAAFARRRLRGRGPDHRPRPRRRAPGLATRISSAADSRPASTRTNGTGGRAGTPTT